MDPLKYDFALRGPAITRGCLEPLYKMKALFVLVRSSQRNCEGSANDEGIDFPTHKCDVDSRSSNRQMQQIILASQRKHSLYQLFMLILAVKRLFCFANVFIASFQIMKALPDIFSEHQGNHNFKLN